MYGWIERLALGVHGERSQQHILPASTHNGCPNDRPHIPQPLPIPSTWKLRISTSALPHLTAPTQQSSIINILQHYSILSDSGTALFPHFTTALFLKRHHDHSSQTRNQPIEFQERECDELRRDEMRPDEMIGFVCVLSLLPLLLLLLLLHLIVVLKRLDQTDICTITIPLIDVASILCRRTDYLACADDREKRIVYLWLLLAR